MFLIVISCTLEVDRSWKLSCYNFLLCGGFSNGSFSSKGHNITICSSQVVTGVDVLDVEYTWMDVEVVVEVQGECTDDWVEGD